MNLNVSLPAECRRLVDALDAGETIGSWSEHLAVCPGCAQEMEARKIMNNRLRLAHEKITPPLGLETRVRTTIRNGALQRRPWWEMRGFSLGLVATAALVLVAGLGLAYQLGHLRWTAASQDSYLASVSNSVASILRVGLKDHIHCAFYRKYPKNPPPVEQFVRDLGPEYRDLVGVVSRQAPAGFHLMEAHQCRYQGRQFVHLILNSDSRLLSLVIARKGEGESFSAEQLLPVHTSRGTPFYQAQAQRFSISAFETARHLVYTVSDLSLEQNMQIMASLAPEVQIVLARVAL